MQEIIRKYIGISYTHNGRDLEGLDCLGLITNFLADNGITLPKDDGIKIKKNWYEDDPKRFIEGLEKYANKIEFESKQPLDVVVFCFCKVPTHSGVLVSRNKFIHVLEDRKVEVSRLKRWQNRLHSIWRVR